MEKIMQILSEMRKRHEEMTKNAEEEYTDEETGEVDEQAMWLDGDYWDEQHRLEGYLDAICDMEELVQQVCGNA